MYINKKEYGKLKNELKRLQWEGKVILNYKSANKKKELIMDDF